MRCVGIRSRLAERIEHPVGRLPVFIEIAASGARHLALLTNVAQLHSGEFAERAVGPNLGIFTSDLRDVRLELLVFHGAARGFRGNRVLVKLLAARLLRDVLSKRLHRRGDLLLAAAGRVSRTTTFSSASSAAKGQL